MSNIKLFQTEEIRSTWNERDQQWYFVVSDVVQVLTDTPNPADYLKKMRRRDEQLSQGWDKLSPPFINELKGKKKK